ncbi:multisubunit sodium/proton antiporter, MrpA subunit /multisubunit sodium/proton antiporter, MrpB subunit [Agrococcus baldri]|uniref:Multisubunit sodium/proton antiporter, MrpA subunit /multisubunit sodium/proton antiporter, MrpB subunit n=1 Tax=Agrococcus baldri TaxID=153730 RepID=A0AA94KZZ4_9MICO|nr:Na+/H+ antiporter subunit A [Agrococcus baldri]SFS15259.1 multisubunit sodium/proton antiporter, MrpA subunit /multisubunit sodium/proton antiporter, MrpB subunit [Agrococcus baldri]
MLLTVSILAVLGVVASALSSRLGRFVFLLPATASIAAAVWFGMQGPAVAAGEILRERIEWMPALDIAIDLRLGALQWLLAMVVLGVGGLIFVYCAWYFESHTLASRTVGLLTGFAASMLLLVLSDDLIVLMIGWELTTIFSYLLVGLNHRSASNRRAAQTALIVTTIGGLTMLTGVVLLKAETGTFSLAATLAEPPQTTAAAWAAALMIVGALSKSAIVPFQYWLPGAMAAPTPVSAFLHAAAMVKAGIFLIAALSPAFVELPWWRWGLVSLGIVTMMLGAVRAMRQLDIKVLLAHGTVSQLGLLVTVLGLGTHASMQAGLTLLAAHAVFKAALFMVVGVVDKSTGTRDLRALGGLARRMPVVAGAAILAAASMAGIPPALGFLGKEAALDAALGDAEGGLMAIGWLAFVGIAVGAALTVAYSLRFVLGIFFGSLVTEPKRRSRILVIAPALLALLGLVGGFSGELISELLDPQVEAVPAGEDAPHLALWHGFTPALVSSMIAWLLGALLHRAYGGRRRAPHGQDPLERGYHAGMRALDRLAVEVTGRTQTGSLPMHLTTILLVVVAFPGIALLLSGALTSDVRLHDSAGQVATAVIVSIAAVIATTTRGRLKAFMLLSVVGYGVALLFLLHGGPDLALVQALTETVFLVILVLVLRRLPKYFTDRPLRAARYMRAALGIAVGTFAALGSLAALQSRTAEPISGGFYRWAYEFGHGANIVNVTLVDIRAWDTLGEVSVVLAAATGVASLIFVRRPTAGTLRRSPSATGRRTWLRGAFTSEQLASPVLEMMTRLLFPVMMTVSIYLLAVGHNEPGGGFAGGLVAGIALAVRYLAGGGQELLEAVPFDAGKLLGGGMAVIVLSVVWPVLIGGRIGESYAIEASLPLLGDQKLVTTIFFDIGVWLIVIGAMLDFVRSLGAGIDLHSEQNVAPRPQWRSDRSLPGEGVRR